MSKQLREITYTECKTFNCAWRRFNPLVPPRGDVTMSLRCIRGCLSERHDRFNRHTGELVGREYVRPDDWKNLGVRLSKDELRLAMMHMPARRLRAVS